MTGERTIVMLHGVGCDRTMWDKQVAALEPSARVIRYDLLCHGVCRRPDHPVALPHFSDQLIDVLDEHGLGRAAIVGFSFGGMIAQHFAATYPDRVETLVIMGAVYRRSAEQLAGIHARLAEAERDGTQAMVPAALERWLTPEFRESHPDEVDKIVSRLQRNVPEDFLSAYRVFVHSDAMVAGRLKRITAPTLVIAGENDPGSTPDMARAMAAEINDATLHIVAGGRHMLPVEWADEINQVLRDFLLD